jgi:hypothetical protein
MKKISRIMIAVTILLAVVFPALGAEQNIEVFPSKTFDRYTIYETLACFWAGIIGLIVIIRMKLKEIERTRSIGIDREEKDIPFLASDNERAAP